MTESLWESIFDEEYVPFSHQVKVHRHLEKFARHKRGVFFNMDIYPLGAMAMDYFFKENKAFWSNTALIYTEPEKITNKIASHPSIQNLKTRKSTFLNQFLADSSMLMNIIHDMEKAENPYGIMACASLLFSLTAALSAFPVEKFGTTLISVTHHLDDPSDRKYYRYAKAMQCMIFADLKFKQAHASVFGNPCSVQGLTYLSPITTPTLKPMSKYAVHEQEEISKKRFRINSLNDENTDFFVVTEEDEQKNDDHVHDGFSSPIHQMIDWDELNI